MGLLRTILIIALVYYGIKILSRIFAPFLLKYAAKKAEQRFGDQFGQFQKGQKQFICINRHDPYKGLQSSILRKSDGVTEEKFYRSYLVKKTKN